MIQKKLFVVLLVRIITMVLLVSTVQAADLSVKSVEAATDDAKVERVLYLNSYNRGYRWSDDLERGLKERLKKADHKIELSVEYLDGRRFPGTARNDLVAATMAAKYAGYRHDIVVISDNYAFDFAILYRKQLFYDLPIVFCGYNNFRPDVLKGIGNITGVNEEVDFAKTVDFATQIQPALRNLVFIISTGDDSNRRMATVTEDTLFPKLRKGYHLIVLKDASMAEIGTRLGALSPDSAVFLVGMTSDLIQGRRPTSVENSRMIAAVSPVPVYSFWDFALGTGILGGHIITGLDQGRTTADMVLRVLAGTPADRIPVIMPTPARNIIDFNVMQKFGINVNALPARCSFINRPVSLLDRYGWYIGTALLAISLESLLIMALVLSLRQRKAALRILGIERDLLDQRVEKRTEELQHINELLEEEIRARNRTEKVITARLRLLEFATTHTMDELLETTIDEAEALTGSAIGFYHFLETDQNTLSLQNWSTRTKAEFCRTEDKVPHHDLLQAGAWIDCIHQQRPVIHNDYASFPHPKRMPSAHAPIIRELVLPVLRDDSIVAIIGVGNKPHDYTAEDIETVAFLADLSWEITERKRAEEALKQAHDELEHRVTLRTRELLQANEALRSEIAERKRAEDTMQLLSSKLLTSQEEEQRRIAMELHDQTGQDILVLKLQLQALKRQLIRGQTNLQTECDKILTFTNRIIEDVRRLSHGLSPSQLQILGLRAALKELIQNFSEKTRIPIYFDVDALDNGFRPETEIVLYRIFQEALTNIYKHARAEKVWIKVCRQVNRLTISIKDDGQGFDSNRHRASEPAVARGMGLSALELRSRMIGADLKILSQPGEGTEINLFVPIEGNTAL
jgi:signal transduction histidine kinase/ABC-type uncharacterized transport system substrate-binding protein